MYDQFDVAIALEWMHHHPRQETCYSSNSCI